MPQSGGRKKPFSVKQKKEQLKAKRERKRDTERDEFGAPVRQRGNKRHDKDDTSVPETGGSESSEAYGINKLSNQPQRQQNQHKGYDQNRYKLHFLKESQAEIQRRKEEARKTIAPVSEVELEVNMDDIYRPGSCLDMPKRPAWDYNMRKDRLLAKEESYFKQYLETILEKHGADELSYFEVNLETWRQLWRVIEMADVVLLITDIRHPAFHFPPAFHSHVTQELRKPLVLILNKIDLAPPELVAAWKHYFRSKYPDLDIVCFTSFPREHVTSEDPSKVLQRKRRKNLQYAAGPTQLLQVLEKIAHGKVDLSSWHDKLAHEMTGREPTVATQVALEENTGDHHAHQAFQDGVLTLGCCGYPNVGKSSLINGLMGRKVVSVSKTPGHTKHFQTIYLTPNVKLCDSPGLVFPSLVPKPMQILSGIYPIAQVREPYTPVGFLAQRLSVQRLLALRHPDVSDMKPHERLDTADEAAQQWSAMDICEAWAEKRRFFTAKAARLDVYRAANHLLRLAVEGRLCLCTRPPNFTQQQDFWAEHPETNEIASLQRLHRKQDGAAEADDSDSEEVTSDSDHVIEGDVDSICGGDDDGDSVAGSDDGAASSNPYALLSTDE